MLNKIFIPKDARPQRRPQKPACDDEKRFEALYVRSFSDMRARSLRR
ncbi:hypothetical protein [Qipengyuania flava]|nr:hypothetical protein [Qipengyuania flava]QYJ08153.1 hypothetical protein KUV82_05475 [Qipengyuania flava]